MKYTNADNSMINAGDDWQALGFQGRYIPCAPGNSDYDKIIRESVEILPYEAPPSEVPGSVTPWQAREALRLAGILGLVNSYIDALGSDHAAYIAWHYAERIRRNSPLVESLAPAFNLTEGQLDNLFITAAGLSL
jgi:hypothetical protein